MTASRISASHRRRRIIDELTLTLTPGVLTALLGPNASGKTTLIRCLAGIHPLDSGRITVNGDDLRRLTSTERSRRVAYVPQDNPMAFAYTVAELVGLGNEVSQSEPSIKNTLKDTLQLLDLEGLEQRSVLTLSGGERQRAAVARAIAQNADYLLLDEPAAHLDLRHQKLLLTILQGLAHQKNKGVLVSLHDLNLAAAFADQIILLASGKIVAHGTPQETLTIENIRRVYQTEIRIENADGLRPRLHIFPAK